LRRPDDLRFRDRPDGHGVLHRRLRLPCGRRFDRGQACARGGSHVLASPSPPQSRERGHRILLHNLAAIALAQHDYAIARPHAQAAVDFYDDRDANAGPRAPEARRGVIRRHMAIALMTLGRVELATGQDAKAEAAYDRALKLARLSGLSEVEISLL